MNPGAPAQVSSPCTNVCRMDPASGWCLGCRRTIDEIASWSSISDDERRDILRRLPARRAASAGSGAAASGPSAASPPAGESTRAEPSATETPPAR